MKEIQEFFELEAQNRNVIRVISASNAMTEINMQKQGFFFVERTVRATISVAKISADIDRFIRLPIIETTDYKDDILNIAINSFLYDRRFHLLPELNTVVASSVLKKWIDDLDNVLVALYKNKPIGFLALKETDANTLFVHLAAVEEKYRITGAAMALYARACEITKKCGYKKLEGRISTQNTAVANIYANFGAVFSDPQDVFIKEVKK